MTSHADLNTNDAPALAGILADELNIPIRLAVQCGAQALKSMDMLKSAAQQRDPQLRTTELLGIVEEAKRLNEQHPEFTAHLILKLPALEGMPSINPETGLQEFADSNIEIDPISVSARHRGEKLVRGPVLFKEADRRRSIIENTLGAIYVAPNPEADPNAKPYHLEHVGRHQVKLHDDLIEREAKRQGIDPDLVRSVMYLENAQGWYGHLSEGMPKWAPESLQSDTILPMNVSQTGWNGLGFSPQNAHNPEANVAIGTQILGKIQDRLVNPNVATIGTLYNGLGFDQVSDYGAQLQEIFDAKPWLEGSHGDLRRSKQNW